MKEDFFDKIDDYLFDNISEEEKLAFEAEMKSNVELTESVTQQRLEHRAMQLLVRSDLRNQISAWKEEKLSMQDTNTSQPSVPKEAKRITLNSRLYRWAAAAVILLAVGFFARWVFTSPSISDETLATLYYETPSFGTQKDVNGDPAFTEAIQQMQSKQYEKAIEILRSIQNPALKIPSLFLIADAYFKLKNYTSAATTSKEIISTTDDILLQQQAEWLLLMSKLACGQRDTEFDMLLNKMLNTNHAYTNQAEKIAKKL